MKTKLMVLALLALVGGQGCASIGMMGLEGRAMKRAKQQTHWFDMLEHGELTVEDYNALLVIQGPLKLWYE